MQVVGQNTFSKPHKTPHVQVRTVPVYSLLSGEPYGLISEHSFKYEERVSFGPARSNSEAPNPTEWIAVQIEKTAAHVSQHDVTERPIIISAPHTALAHANTAIAANTAVRSTHLCHQEICLEFCDTAFASDPTDVIQKVAKLKRCGFRVGVDMRKSWNSALTQGLALLLDTIRVDALEIYRNTDLQDMVLAAKHAGVFVIADNAKWRDGEYLESLGILGAVCPIADS